MSAPLELNVDQLRGLADFLDGLAVLEVQTGWHPCPYGPANVAIGDGTAIVVRRIVTDAAHSRYVVSDQVGD